MFGETSGTWIDGAFFNTLRYVDGMHLFFMQQARILAMICFALSIGISCVKMAMGATEINKVLTQTFIALATYLMMIFLFPRIMIQMQKIISNLSYGAVFSQAIDVKLESKYGTEENFIKYLNEIGSDNNGNTVWNVERNGKNDPIMMQLQITHAKTGIISLNKVFQMIIATFKALWKSLNVNGIVDFFKHIGDFLMIITIALAYVFALSVALVEYAMTVVQYTFLYGMGVLFIPLMLWEGTKHAFEKLCGSIFNIGIRLLVVQTTLYLVVMTNVDILKNMFALSNGTSNSMQRIEFYLSIIFMVVFAFLFVKQAPAIADFLCGGQPRIGFAEFAQAVKSTAAAGMPAAKAGGSLVKGAATGGIAAVGALAAAGGSARIASNASKEQGGSAGENFKAGLSSFGSSIGQSAKQGGANILDKGIDAVANVPHSLKSAGQLMGYGMNPTGPLSAEAMGLGKKQKPPGNRGTPDNGGGNMMVAGGINGNGSSMFFAAGSGNNKQPTEGERLMQSHNVTDRIQGMGALYNEKRAQGMEYSGLGGRIKALKNSIGEFHSSNKQAAPGKNPSAIPSQQKTR